MKPMHFHAVQTPIDGEPVAEETETNPEWDELLCPDEDDEWAVYGAFEAGDRAWLNYDDRYHDRGS